MLKLTLPDGKVLQLPDKSTGMQAAEAIGRKLAKEALAIEVNGETRDLSREIEKDSKIKILTFSDEKGKEVFRHSTAHIFAQAIKQLYPEAKPTIGPAVEEGFYYDFDDLKITPEDFEKIQIKMQEIVNADHPFERIEWTMADVKKLNNQYKTELAEEYKKQGLKLTAYKSGDFADLCEGPHVPTTKYIKAFKLTKIAAAYWKGDQKNKQLTRIYGISFPSTKELHEHEKLQEEIEKRDHRKIGQKLELFMTHEWSPGSPFFLPKGTLIYNELLKYIREEYWKRGYQEVITPQMFNKALWEQSGHWAHFKENMFTLEVDNEEFSLKPMNCPSHVLIFKSKTRSYRDLPLRIADFCYLYRNEVRGTLGGLTRVRKLSQDDAHIFCTPEQIKQEIKGVLDFIKFIYTETFKMPYKAKLSTKPDKAMGAPELWEQAEKSLADALKELKIPYDVAPGEGAFYGPKIDCFVKDVLGREWQCATCQLDFQMPLRMGAEYEGEDNKKHTSVMIHRALLGTLERFMGVMIEHYAGKFPLWISPEQVRVLTVADRFEKDAQKLVEEMRKHHIKATLDATAETINKKVRNAQVDQVNYILVYGEKEQQTNSLQIRTRDNKVSGPVKTEQFIQDILKEIAEKQ
ncbi:threonine--tRNA ligase [Candidatus Woesearchaeota archaeon]|nr:threonine--tRNA ligase [Candidatus Woesearchaeota archaeon]MBW3016127.1 threonine--tRNA ligase [Candidatus Woesearchaeota archaeon]